MADTMDQEGFNYPLHLGVTEAGDGDYGRIKSTAGIATLLAEGVGGHHPSFTHRIARKRDPCLFIQFFSLSAYERQWLNTLPVRVVAARCSTWRMSSIKFRNATSHLKGLDIAVMGCIVNGPGEMADADYGLCG
jgi:(E)-4-hydroxy-3-methylbut-2-enyl-diphosphate synthase